MKHLAPLLACLVLISCTHPPKHKKNDLETLHYKGRVKVVVYKIYHAMEDSGKVKKGGIISKVITKCDSNGYFVQQSNYKGGEKLIYEVVHTYDKDHNLISEMKTEDVMQYLSQDNSKPDSLNTVVDSFNYKLDEKGNKRVVKVKENGKPWYRDVNMFDDKGNVILSKEYVPWDTLNKTEKYKYDDKGNLVEKAAFRADSSLFIRYTYKYDDASNLVEVVTYNGMDSIRTKETMKYDDKGNKTLDVSVKGDGTSQFDWHYEFTDFDKTGNWIRELTYSSGKPQSVVERLIEYYK